MDRRTLLQTATLTALAGLAGTAQATSPPVRAHQHHHHGGDSRFGKLASSAGHCISTGETCLARCLVLLGQGDKEMAACGQSVSELLAVCTALQKLALQESNHTAALARMALAVCEECEKECRKHEKKHKQCKDCADACADCTRQCKQLAA